VAVARDTGTVTSRARSQEVVPMRGTGPVGRGVDVEGVRPGHRAWSRRGGRWSQPQPWRTRLATAGEPCTWAVAVPGPLGTVLAARCVLLAGGSLWALRGAGTGPAVR
jgi:hypothetical protein